MYNDVTKKLQVRFDVIQELINLKGWTITGLSQRSGLSRNQLNKIRKGKISDIRLSTIRALADALDVSPKVFVFEGKEEKNGE